MIVGIDLGTTNSVIAVWRGERAELIPNSLGSVLTPSAVSIGDQGEVLVGLAARERQVTHPALTATVFKRYMGSRRVTQLGRQRFLPEELSALVLRSLKADAERHLGEPVTQAVITVPAYFNDRQRKATRRAGQLAGLSVERLLNEPTAAALAYGIHQKDVSSRFLVFDLGGGTFDVSVLELFEGVIEVKSSTGDNRLGGEDFNALLIEKFFKAHGSRQGVVPATPDESSPLYQRVRDQAERCRRALSSQPQSSMQVVWDDRAYELEITAEELEKAAEPLMERLRAPVIHALRDGKVRADALDEIVLVGGATRMPIVRRAVTKMFGRFPAAHVHPDEAVAIGAAIQAGLKARDAALKEVVLTDVCPYTLGVDMAERLPSGAIRTGVFAPIIERNTIVPASRERVFTTIADGQRVVKVNVYQGESRNVSDNVHLGALEIPVPMGRVGEVRVTCRFTYDINGLLEIDLQVPATGERRELVIVDDPEGVEPAELEQRRKALAALKVHPRDDQVNIAILARLERCYEQALGDRREAIGRWISQFTTVLESQDPRAIADARTKLIGAMDSIEGESFL
ncbi:MAG TPA: molecular chaperone HscC [Steroidobacteraceae bacterium]|nr:molecular chaperone HscC [Steroidobacteraceae bacterium]